MSVLCLSYEQISHSSLNINIIQCKDMIRLSLLTYQSLNQDMLLTQKFTKKLIGLNFRNMSIDIEP